MADNTNITGIADGVLEQALEGVPQWATEETLSSMHGLMNKSVALEASMEKILRALAKTNLDPKKWNDLNDGLDQMLKDFDQTHKDFEKRKKDEKEQRDNHTKGTKLYKLLFDSQYRLDQALFVTTAALKGMVNTMVKNVKTFDRLYESGIAVSSAGDGARDAFDSLRQMSVLAGMSVEKFGAIAEKSAGANALGLGKFAKTLPAVSKNLQMLGYDVAQAAEATGAYLDSMLGFADIQSKSQEEIEEGAIRFGKSLQKLSLITGISRQKLLENTAAISQSTDANVLAGTIGEEGALRFSEFVASFKDQNIGQQFLKMMSSKIPALNSTFQNFAKAGLGNMGMQIVKFTKSLAGLSPDRAALATKNFVNSLGNLDAIINHQQLLAEAGVEGAEENIKILVGLRQQANAAKELSLEEIEKNEKAAAASAKIRSAWMGIMGTFSNIFSPTLGELEALGNGLEWVNEKLKAVGQWMANTKLSDIWAKLTVAAENTYKWLSSWKMSDFTPSKIYEALKTSFQSAFENISKWFSSLDIKKSFQEMWTGIKDTISQGLEASVADITKYVLAAGVAILAFTKGMTLLKSVMTLGRGARVAGAAGALGNAAGEKGGGLMSGIGKGIGALGEGVGKALGGLGAGTGKLIEGLLTGVAAGLRAFANPQILLGAAILSGSIAVIGAGIAGATWLIGKSLPAFAEGLKSFDGIDGSNLIEIAKGVGALGLAMAAFGAGSVVSSFGNVISTISGAFSKLFGDGSILDQIKAFANIGPGIQAAANGISTVTMGLSNLSSTLNSFTGLDKLTQIVKAINSIDLLKAAAFGVLGGKINTPVIAPTTSISVPKAPAASTIKSPSATPANPAMANNSSGQAKSEPAALATPGIEKPPAGSDINSVLTYQSSLMEQILIATNTNLSVNKDILKYSKNRA